MHHRSQDKSMQWKAWIGPGVLALIAVGLGWYFMAGQSETTSITIPPPMNDNEIGNAPSQPVVSPISPVSPVDIEDETQKKYLSLYEQGLNAYKAGNFNQALTHYNEALELNPTGVDLLIGRGNVYLALGKLMDAAADYDTVLGIAPDNGYGFYNRGRLLTLSGEYEKALADFLRAADKEPRLAYDALVNRGVVYFKMEKYDQALTEFDKAIATDPNQAQAYLDKGTLLNQTNRFEEAIDMFNQALAIDRQLGAAYWAKGWAEYNSGQYANSINSSRQAANLMPEKAAILFNMGLAQLANNQIDEAQQTYLQALEQATPTEKESAIRELDDLKQNFPNQAKVIDVIIKNLKGDTASNP